MRTLHAPAVAVCHVRGSSSALGESPTAFRGLCSVGGRTSHHNYPHRTLVTETCRSSLPASLVAQGLVSAQNDSSLLKTQACISWNNTCHLHTTYVHTTYVLIVIPPQVLLRLAEALRRCPRLCIPGACLEAARCHQRPPVSCRPLKQGCGPREHAPLPRRYRWRAPSHRRHRQRAGRRRG